ncbi:creatininase family protein [Variovorax terrae]|uniref:Creatininase family protein n=1 Tax=Variovorax terrae TaxID=2923278 RepID=A0A9X1W1E2_9BURK|nr:creatininase family protein [Variovorax terrae]MCJ0764348.1 creatininase family protein [Variovorax terrae]
MKRQWAEYTCREFAALDRENLIAVLPVSAIEQHGPHLPLSVDTTIVEGVIDRVIGRLPDDLPVLFLPTQRVGKSNEHSRYPGTLTFSIETLIRIWMEIGDSVAAAGVRKLVILNSHGGQGMVGEIVARDLRVKHDMMVIATNTYSFGTPAGMFSAAETQHGIHAGDKETSLLLALRPDLVDMAQAQNFRSSAEQLVSDTRHLSINARAKLGWQVQDLNPHGACGDASIATAEKGDRVIDHIATHFIEMLRDVHQTSPQWLAQQPVFA